MSRSHFQSYFDRLWSFLRFLQLMVRLLDPLFGPILKDPITLVLLSGPLLTRIPQGNNELSLKLLRRR